MFCQCRLDACLARALECMLFSDPRGGLTRLALGAYENRQLLEDCISSYPGNRNGLVLYLYAHSQEWTNFLLQVISDYPVYLLDICCQLLLEPKCWIFCLYH